MVRRISNFSNTQDVESMNAEYAKSLPKQLAWKYAQPRLDAAVLKHNEPETALAVIAECCDAKLSTETLEEFAEQARNTALRNQSRRTDEARKQKNEQRMNLKRSNKGNPNEGYNTKKAKLEE